MRSRITAALLASLLTGGEVQAAGESGELRAKEAATALQRGQTERATQLYTEALADTGLPNNRRAAIYNDRGVAFSRINQSRVAIDDFNKAAQLAPETASIYNNRGNVLLAIGFAREAVKDFDRAILLAPGYSAAYSNRANAYTRLGETDAAARDFNNAIRLTPQAAAPYFGRGKLHLALNRPHAALRDFGRAVTHDVRFTQGYKGRADAKLALGRFDDAIEDLSRAIAFEPNTAELYLIRGYSYLAARNAPSAIKDFARAAEIDARSNAAYEGLALANAKTEAFDDALNQLGKALDIEPRSAQAYAYRAMIYKWLGQVDIGSKDLERALKLEPARPEVLWVKAEFADPASGGGDQVADLRKAVAARPWLRDAAAALDRLGAAIGSEVEVKDLAFERWRVYVENGRHTAYNAELPRLAVPLEVTGEVSPRILRWDTKSPPFKGLGILYFSAGQVEGKSGPEDIEHGAVIDLAARTVIAIETVRQGTRQATWTWDETKLVVTGIDSHAEEYPLKGKTREVAQTQQPTQQRRVTSSETKYGPGDTPGWAPWSQPWGGGGGGGGRQRQQPQKSLFDMIFKGN